MYNYIWVKQFYIKQYNFSICHIELCVGRIDLCIGRVDLCNSGESTYFRASRLIFIRASRLSGDSTRSLIMYL